MCAGESKAWVLVVTLLVSGWNVPAHAQAPRRSAATEAAPSTPSSKGAAAGGLAANTPRCAGETPRSADPSALCPVVWVGLGLLAASAFGFHFAAKTEAAPRVAIYVARSAHATLLCGLALVIIYAVAVAAFVLLR